MVGEHKKSLGHKGQKKLRTKRQKLRRFNFGGRSHVGAGEQQCLWQYPNGVSLSAKTGVVGRKPARAPKEEIRRKEVPHSTVTGEKSGAETGQKTHPSQKHGVGGKPQGVGSPIPGKKTRSKGVPIPIQSP